MTKDAVTRRLSLATESLLLMFIRTSEKKGKRPFQHPKARSLSTRGEATIQLIFCRSRGIPLRAGDLYDVIIQRQFTQAPSPNKCSSPLKNFSGYLPIEDHDSTALSC